MDNLTPETLAAPSWLDRGVTNLWRDWSQFLLLFCSWNCREIPSCGNVQPSEMCLRPTNRQSKT